MNAEKSFCILLIIFNKNLMLKNYFVMKIVMSLATSKTKKILPSCHFFEKKFRTLYLNFQDLVDYFCVLTQLFSIFAF